MYKNNIRRVTQGVLSSLIIISFLSISAHAQDEKGNRLLNIMETELARAKDLKLDIFGPPYFVSYQIKDNFSVEIGVDHGAVYKEDTNRGRNLFVEVRVGDYNTDNSDVGSANMMGKYMYLMMPVEDDEDSIRRSLWIITDREYKNAISAYHSKKGKDVQNMETDKIPDFSKGNKNVYIEEVTNEFPSDINRWKGMLKATSLEFKKFDFVLKSDVTLSAKKTIRYYINSEGAKIVDQITLFSINISGWAQADDGMWLTDTESIHYKDMKDMPDEKDIAGKVALVANNLKELKGSKLIDPYIGPAIFSPDASGVLFHEAVGHRLEGERQRNEREGGTFKNKIGEAIMPDFMNIYDNPSIEGYNGVSLFGYYKFDDEGQKGDNVQLVEKGVLKNFLMSKTPVKGFDKGNGHGRSDSFMDPVARMSNLIVKSDKETNEDELKKMLIEEAKRQNKEYGLLIKKVVGGETNTSRYNFQAFKGSPTMIYKVYVSDGRTELVRGAEFVGTPLSSINRILATGGDYKVFNGYCGAESGFVPSSAVAPSVLLSEIELQKKVQQNTKLPILPSPPQGVVK